MSKAMTWTTDGLRLWSDWVETCANTAITITSRVVLVNAAILGGRGLPLAEMSRMVLEKQKAAFEASSGVLLAEPGLAAASALLAPYHQATRQNARRLTRRRG
ncbi:hypothetical protein [Arboricoccus pini]|uniref:hypothetical protein n=1 Tax=Arboricoccus pini TaxID=1963835 RepID=UPI0010550139|nr:hypothetical protein [Arboricoccus pini]